MHYTLFLVPDGKKVGLASIAKDTDKKGDIVKQDLAAKVESKTNKKEKKKEKKEDEPKAGKVEEKVEVTEAPKAETV